MFIYKITVIPINQIYIGLDTKPTYKLSRWKSHQREASANCRTKLHKAIAQYGIDNCNIEILESGFETIADLAISEIEYIKKFDSYHNGLNSTPGGDGLGKHNLSQLTDNDLEKIKKTLGDSFRNYNKNIKWANTSQDDRKKMMSHLFTEDVNRKKSKTLKEFYKNNPEIAASKSLGIKKWQLENREKMLAQNSINSRKGIAKLSKKIKIEKEDGSILFYDSKSEFHKETGQWANTILKKTKNGKFHNGYKAYEI